MKIGKADLGVALYILAAFIMLIISIPSWLLDIFLAVNIGIAFVILFTVMFTKEVLDMSFFPTMLLFTTIFRIALNVSSTKLILLTGNPGNVVSTFGNYVGGGDLVVGVIIFIILILIQFMVINKGSERVAEVTARFTLDAMPGKQMAIDADLNTGAITDEEAKIRRANIQRESDFFGAMDGATKFVKGDAIISIITALVNLIGGAVIGMINGGDINTVMSTYSLATVGDGLCSQIPALLISVATGMVVTRSASTGSFNEDVKRQFTRNPTVMFITGGVCLTLMLVPGFPKPILIILGIALILGGYAISRSRKHELALQAEAEEQKRLEEIKAANAQGDSNYYRDIDNVFKLLSVEQIEMEFGYSLLHLVDEKSGGNFIDRVVLFRKQFALDMGMVIPSVRMRNNPEINPNQYVIKIKGEEVARGEILVDHLLALDNGEVTKPVEGIDTIEPAFGIPAKWISEDKKVMADIAGYTLIDPVSVMITHLSEVIKAHCSEILSRQDVRTMVENVKKTDSTIVEDLVPNVVSYGYLQKILCMLLSEGVPIRDMETILECLGDHGATLKDIELTVEYVRQSLKRTITRRFADGGSLRVITLDPKLEDIIISGVKKNSSGGSVLSLDPETVNAIVANTSEEIDKVKDVLPSIVILMSPFTRIYYKKLLDQFMPGITVLSYSEIDNNTQIQAVGNISI